MALINRLSRLVTADFHAVLDRIEEPEALLSQAIREMEEAIAASAQRIKSLQQDQARHEARAVELTRLIEQAEQQLDVCFEAEQAELAKGQIKRKLEAERLLTIVGGKRQQLSQALSTEHDQLKDNRARLDSMKQKAELFAQQQPVPTDLVGDHDFVVSDDEVEVAYLREQQRRAAS